MPIDDDELLEEIEDRIDDHVNDPHHRGRCADCTHAHEGENPLCGDVIRMELKVDDRGTMREVFFDGRGCRISQASASMLAERATGLYEQSRHKVARFIGASSPQEIIFTSGTTAGINLVARSWGDANLRSGDEILVTEMEHHSNLVPWHQLAERTGAVIRWTRLTDDGLLALDDLDRLLGPRTRLVAVTAVSNVLGTVNPVSQIVRRAHDAGAIVLVDGAQSVPHQKTDVTALDCDFLAFSGHKMLGPSGIGVLYGKRELLERMPPFLGGGGMIHSVWVDRFEPASLGDSDDPRPARFEAGTPPIVPAIGLSAAIDYLEHVGLDAIHRHERFLTLRAHRLLQAVPGLRILGPGPEAKGGIVSFVLADEDLRPIHGHDVAERLDRHGIAVRASHHCAEPLHRRYGLDATVRASFYFYNTPEEVDLLGEALQEPRHAFQRRRKDER